jgi:hypothetical protein
MGLLTWLQYRTLIIDHSQGRGNAEFVGRCSGGEHCSCAECRIGHAHLPIHLQLKMQPQPTSRWFWGREFGWGFGPGFLGGAIIGGAPAAPYYYSYYRGR